MASCLRQLRREAIPRDAASSRGPGGTPPRPATLILCMTLGLCLVLLIVRALAALFGAA
ncbi:hypothetical protein [Bosea sp. BH3]|uniref:hypothetical protein n=1 Tax=Bosea sp. BH3 TaxID=2871701 RepID=UPI0021CB34C6|nr:hypothetical protein [Bosea sp. BH3]MCU4181095.1 hypothetical protein [Bosea sp. BH3]